MDKERPQCARCPRILCEPDITVDSKPNFEKAPRFCPSKLRRDIIKEEEKISGPGWYESMCNPITQAEILNSEEVDFVILMGLCVGHDTLFIRYCRALMTVLAVKDRVTGHNPLAAVYLSHSYYERLKGKTAG